MIDVSTLLGAHSEQNELQLIGWICENRRFLDVPDGFLYTTTAAKMYEALKKQWFGFGHLEPSLLDSTLIEVLDSLDNIAIPTKSEMITKQLREFYQKRELAATVAKTVKDLCRAKADVGALILAMSDVATRLIVDGTEESYSHSESVKSFCQKVKESQASQKSIRGVPSPLPDVDIITSGFEYGKGYLVGGLEKLGKSRFVRACASNWLNDNLGGIIFMLEEDADAIHECIVANRTRVNTQIIGTNLINGDQLQTIERECDKYAKQPLYVCTKSAPSPEYVRSVIQREKIKMQRNGHKLAWVIIDYVQRMSGNGKSPHEQSEHIANSLANTWRDEKVIGIMISQVTSDVERQAGKGGAIHSYLRYGKVYKEAATCTIIFDDPERTGKKKSDKVSNKPYKTLLAHILQRKGISSRPIAIRAELQYSSFSNFAKEHEENEQTEQHHYADEW